MEAPAPQIRHEQLPPEREAVKAPTVLKLSLENPNWRRDPNLGPQITSIEGGLAGINQVNILMTEFAKEDSSKFLSPKKSAYDAIRPVAAGLIEVNNLMGQAISFATAPNLDNLQALNQLRQMPEAIFGREATEEEYHSGPIRYPKGTVVMDVTLHSGDEIKAVCGNLDGLAHELSTPITSFYGAFQLLERKAATSARKRMSDQLEEVDFDRDYINRIEIASKRILGFTEHEARELLTNSNPLEGLNSLDFFEQLNNTLKEKLPAGVVKKPEFIVSNAGKLWLEELNKKIESKPAPPIGFDTQTMELVKEMDPQDKEIVAEIHSILARYTQHESSGSQQELRTPISHQLMQHMQFIWGIGKMRMIAQNAGQNLQKAFEITEPGSQFNPNHKVVPTIKITAGNHIEFGIEDNGIGLPQGYSGIEKGSTNWGGDKTKGTGIGLDAQRENLRAHYNGDARLEPNPTGGAILIVDLPLKSIQDVKA